MKWPPKIGLAVALATAVPAASAQPSAEFRQEFTSAYCGGCHGGENPQGRFRIDRESPAAATSEAHQLWERAGEYVSKGVMPPADAPQPSGEERERFAESLAAELSGADAPRSNSVLVRRMNRIEYLNTLRDLFQIREIRLPVTFPDDSTDERFDTMTEGAYLTPGHLDAYQEVAIDIADRMVPLPTVQQRSYAADRAGIGIDPARTKYWVREGDATGLYFTGVNIAGWSGALWNKAFAAHASGVYRVRMKVSAEADAGADGKPLRLGFYAFNPADYNLPKRALRVDLPRVGGVEVRSLEPAYIDAELALEKGETFHVYCENRLRKQHPPALIRRRGNTADLRKLLGTYLSEAQAAPEPTIRFEHLEVTGPIAALPRQLEFLRGSPRRDRDYAESLLLPLAERAFRRPLTEEERRDLIASVLEHMHEAPGPEYGLHYGIRRILLSPQFLYRETGGGELDGYGLASRLAYFLWSTMPSEELTALARDGRLADPETLRSQIQRMAADPKAQQFVQHFSGQWLGGRRAAAVMVCDVRHVWSELIRHGIVRSTEMFFDEMLRENRSIREFIDSDFTYANEPMRIAWGIPGNEVDLRRLEADQRQSLLWPEPERLDLTQLGPGVPAHVATRGGVLGLSSVMAATGDGVESSPILRGVWVLENLFGTPLPPPPADVPALVADTSQARTVRQVLAAHQSVASCAMCHHKIDPLGLALENYDAAGAWRTAYYREEGANGKPNPVATTSTMTDGTHLAGAQDIKNYLLERPAQFTRALASLLLEYATGRELDAEDRRAIDGIVETEPEGGYPFQELIAEVVASEAFTRR